jgi:hypothetical protein
MLLAQVGATDVWANKRTAGIVTRMEARVSGGHSRFVLLTALILLLGWGSAASATEETREPRGDEASGYFVPSGLVRW